MSTHLHHKLETVRQSLLHGKLPRDLRWDDAVSLVGHLGEVHEHGGDEFTFVIGAQREIFKRPHSSALGVDDVSRLRHMVKQASVTADSSQSNA